MAAGRTCPGCGPATTKLSANTITAMVNTMEVSARFQPNWFSSGATNTLQRVKRAQGQIHRQPAHYPPPAADGGWGACLRRGGRHSGMSSGSFVSLYSFRCIRFDGAEQQEPGIRGWALSGSPDLGHELGGNRRRLVRAMDAVGVRQAVYVNRALWRALPRWDTLPGFPNRPCLLGRRALLGSCLTRARGWLAGRRPALRAAARGNANIPEVDLRAFRLQAQIPFFCEERLMPFTNLPFTRASSHHPPPPHRQTFHSPRPLQRFSMDMLLGPRGLSGTILTPSTPNSSPCT